MFVLCWAVVPAVLADDAAPQPLQSEDQVLDSLNRHFGPGFISKAEGPSTGAPQDVTGGILTQNDRMTWDDYLEQIDSLNEQLDKGDIDANEHFEKFQQLYQRWGKSQRYERNIRGERPVRPVDAGDIDTSLDRRPLKNPRPVHHD